MLLTHRCRYSNAASWVWETLPAYSSPVPIFSSTLLIIIPRSLILWSNVQVLRSIPGKLRCLTFTRYVINNCYKRGACSACITCDVGGKKIVVIWEWSSPHICIWHRTMHSVNCGYRKWCVCGDILLALGVVCHQSSAKCHILSMVCYQSSAKCHILTVVCHQSSAKCHILSVVCHQSSAKCHILSGSSNGTYL